jgi:N-acylneuraminate cytidylyltransferase
MNIALLTGRAGSISLPEKNIIPVLGRPMMAYAAIMAQQSKLVDDVYLSTDGEKLKNVGRDLGLKIIDRPPELALPTSQHREALEHALDYLGNEGVRPTIMVVLLCNVGTHRPGLIDKSIQLLLDNPELDSVVTVEERNEFHPYRAKRMGPGGLLEPFVEIKGKISTNRQDLEPSYFLDHTFWSLRVATCFGKYTSGQPPWDFMGNRILGLVNQGSIDIHTVEDLAYTEAWLENNGWSHDRIAKERSAAS